MAMTTLRFAIRIAACPEKVWEALWSDAGYRYWTALFTDGSHAETDGWRQGSLVRFMAPGGMGMYSLVEQHEPNALMCFKHLGPVKEGANQPLDAESAVWTGAREQYRLAADGRHVELSVSLETTEEATGYFHDTFPAALARVRERAES